jgi:hypothetical protein
MNDAFKNMPIDEDDVVINLRYYFCYLANSGIDFQERWIEGQIVQAFKEYTFNNSVRLNKIMVIASDCIFFDVKLINPDIAPQTVSDAIHKRLHEAVRCAFQGNSDEMWKEVKILSIGDETETTETIKSYLRRLRTDNDQEG